MEKKLRKLDEKLSPGPFEHEKLSEALDAWEDHRRYEGRHLPRGGGLEDQDYEWHQQMGCVGAAKRKADALKSPDS